jgi:hypothetical protein
VARRERHFERQPSEANGFAILQQPVRAHGRISDRIAEVDVRAASALQQRGRLGIAHEPRAGGASNRRERPDVVTMRVAVQDEAQILRRHADALHVRDQQIGGLRHPAVDEHGAFARLHQQRGDLRRADLPDLIGDAHRLL